MTTWKLAFMALTVCGWFTPRLHAQFIINTVAGNGTFGFSGDGALATNATLGDPLGLAVDASGNLYIADQGNQRIRMVTSPGTPFSVITTVAGNGTLGFSGDGGLPTNASLKNPPGVAVDSGGNLYIADPNNQRVRKVTNPGTPSSVITTVAGDGTAGFSGDGGLATSASLGYPLGVAVDSAGNLYIADLSNQRIRKVDGSTGIITTVAGNGSSGFSGDGGLAVAANLADPAYVTVDGSGNLYIADESNLRIRRVQLRTPLTVAANNYMRVYGSANPLFDVSYVGFINGDGPGSLGGTLSCGTTAVTSSPVGNYPILCGGQSSQVYAITYVPSVLTVLPASTSTSLARASGSVSPSLLGQEVTFVATVASVAPSTAAVSGNVEFFAGTASLGVVPLASASATFSTSALTAGTHSITAGYQDSPNLAASSSVALSQVVTAPTPTGTNVSTPSTVETSTITPTFPSVTSAGQTTVAPIEPSSAGTVPGGYSITGSSLAFEISTTAALGAINPNDPATWIVIQFDVPSITASVAFANLRVLHNESGVLVDRTILSGPLAPDFLNKRIYASVPSLSPFVLSQVTGTTIPQVTGPLNPLALGATATVAANFTDVASQTSHTCDFSWNDTTTNTIVSAPTGASGSCSASHVYAQAGVYTVTVSVSNGSGGPANSKFEYVVVFDPSGGFVTGGGWINSPAGAYATAPSLTGKATFGFVSKYKKGANVPTGQTEFQFHVASFNFQSTVYEWLVIAGHKAQYKGSGTVNGSGNYGFMLTAIDGQENGGGGVDKFRIKIWDKSNNDAIVYDNQMGGTDNADPTTPGTLLGGGSVGIHK